MKKALIVVMALVYVGAAALDRRGFAWVVFLAAFAVIVVLPLLDPGVSPSVVLLVAAPVFSILGVARGLGRKLGGLMLQTAGMLGYSVIALAALSANPEVSSHPMAFGLIATPSGTPSTFGSTE